MVFCNIVKKSNINTFSCHNPYFNRWFSAIYWNNKDCSEWEYCHNPYFNRWFSAIKTIDLIEKSVEKSQSLF